MAHRAIREYDGKSMMARLIAGLSEGEYTLETQYVQVRPETKLDSLAQKHAWLKKNRLVVKPDQLIKRRGKANLVLLDATWAQAKKWLSQRRGKEIEHQGRRDKLEYFLIEPFIEHNQEHEYYLDIQSKRDCDEILFYRQGGVDVGDVESKCEKIEIPVFPRWDRIRRIDLSPLFRNMADGEVGGLSKESRIKLLTKSINAIYTFYANCGFTFLEINPLIIANGSIFPIDMAAKLDDTASFENLMHWQGLEFPPPFGKVPTPEEAYIESLDERTGASLKLTVLNPEGRVWTMVAGGGASVIYADTVVDLGHGAELANYGEYSGNPSTEFTYEYAKTILDLMTRKKDRRGKVLLIGGGIANFTDVAQTFKGIIKALTEYQKKLVAHKVKIYVRRGGPNYQQGLHQMKELGEKLGVPIEVYGPETHMTKIVSLALGAGK